MPYVVMTSQAKLVNTYVCGPIVVGDKGADPQLMKSVGAKLVTNYPACGSPPLYLVYGNPRSVIEKLEAVGYMLVASSVVGDCREMVVWTLRSCGEDTLCDLNSKMIQTSDMDLDDDKPRESQSDRRRSSGSKKRSSTSSRERVGSKEKMGSKEDVENTGSKEKVDPVPETDAPAEGVGGDAVEVKEEKGEGEKVEEKPEGEKAEEPEVVAET